MEKQIYLDNAATTKVDSVVAERVLEVMEKNFGNASSQHSFGKNAKELLESSREKIAKFIGAKSSEIIFTSGGTESNNLAIKGLAKANPTKKHIITTEIEHPSVLEVVSELGEQGYKIDYLKVNSDGLVSLEDLKKKIGKDTLMVSVMHVNNEIGVIQDIEETGKICREKKVYFHVDAVQSFCKLEINVEKMKIDLMSVSGHKINAPKGIGFLYVRNGVSILPEVVGGGQERRLRSGTENVPGIVGLATAIGIKRNKEKILRARNKLIDELLKIEGSRLNGSREKRIYNNLNVSFYGIEGEGLMLMLDGDGIFVSTGSACASTKLSESHVLKAIGVDEMYVHGSIRMTIDELTDEEIKYIVESVKKNVAKLREMSPFKFGKEAK